MKEDPLLHRTRVETANAMGNAIIDVINAHVRTHGKDDPELWRILIAALGTVVVEINARVHPDFGGALADLLTSDGFGDEDD